MTRTVIGISAFHHDSAACVLRDDELVCAAEEERFTRRKHEGGVPVHAFRWCLAEAGLSIDEIGTVAVGLDPVALDERRGAFASPGSARPTLLDEASVREALGVEAPVRFVSHHLAHAASAFHYSEFDRAAVLVIDGVGEWETTSLWSAQGLELTMLESVKFPHSLGLFYAAVTSWLGFRVNHDEYKVMGLASWGEPGLAPQLDQVVVPAEDGLFRLDLSYFAFLEGAQMYSDRWLAELGPARTPGAPMTDRHRDVAASAQAVLERWMLALAERVHDATRSSTLCVAGGVGLNAVANGRLAREGPFDRVYFQPAAGDAGTALGAASVAMIELGGPRPAPLRDLRLGAHSARDEVTTLLAGLGVRYSVLSEADLVEGVAELLEAGGVVGWFDGAAEFGPRALGARSLLADPRHASIRDRINRSMKERESWRPLAPIIAEESAERFLETPGRLPFMIETTLVRPGVDLEGVTHVDRTARPQTVSSDDQPLLHAVLKAFERRAGVPVLINTSFNHASEPIVDTPAQAVMTAARLGLDGLVIAGYFITKLDLAGEAQLSYWMHSPAAVSSDLYAL